MVSQDLCPETPAGDLRTGAAEGPPRRPAGRAGSVILLETRRHAARNASGAMEAGGVPRRLRRTSPLAAQCEALGRRRAIVQPEQLASKRFRRCIDLRLRFV